LTYTSFSLESSLPIRGSIRAAVPYVRRGNRQGDPEDNIFSRIAQQTNGDEEQNERTDLILCTVDTGELMVVEWMHGSSNQAGEIWSNPGLCVTRVIRQARPGKDTGALGRFVKVSEE